VEMVFVPMLHSVAPLGAIVELDRHGVILLLQYWQLANLQPHKLQGLLPQQPLPL